MEVALKMKMPKSCAECELGRSYGAVGDVKCLVLQTYFTGNTKPPHKERPDECPLVEIKTEERKQFYIPVGKALVAIEKEYPPKKIGGCCEGCDLNFDNCEGFACFPEYRQDGKKVIFKLVDYPSEFCKHPMSMCKD